MQYSRRDLSLLLSAFAAAEAMAESPKLPTTMLRFEDLAVRENGQNRSRRMLEGATHSGFPIEMHATELAPGLAPHPPHHHVHEEMILIREGTMEVTIGSKTVVMGPGSAAYVASNEEHGWRNVGKTRAHYFVLALGREQA